ncbi:MAG: SpoIIE family protein phosphatase [Oligoflexia bacterium]|nr:SpoIIE family protein phosphatase [Oligoflexia bacterium]
MRLTIRKKLNTLLAAVLLLGIGSVIGLATDLFTRDFGRMIEKGTADGVDALSGRMRSELRRLSERAQLLGALSFETLGRQQDTLRFIQERLSSDPDLIALSVWRMRSPGRFELDWRVLRLGVEPELAAQVEIRPDDQTLNSVAQGAIEVSLGGTSPQASFFRMTIPFIKGEKGHFTGLLTFDVRRETLGAVLSSALQVSGALLDRHGRIVESADPAHLPPGALWSASSALPELPTAGQSEAGIRQLRDESSQGRSWTIARRSLGFADLSIAGRAPLDQAAIAKQKLYRRSLSLGIGILCLVLLIGLGLSSALTRPIEALTRAADRIAAGDFSARVTPTTSDELSLLARSFNTMAEKIRKLLAEAVEQARMKKELDTAKAVQQIFSPLKSHESERFRLAGNMLAASECGGDWWHYSRVGERLVVVMGDVTGHGVSAALVTAAAHGAFSLLMKKLDPALLERSPDEWLKKLTSDLNTAILATGGGHSAMTFVATIIDTQAAKAVSVNAAHRPPYLFRKVPETALRGLQDGIRWLAEPGSQALGESDALDPVVSVIDLLPGDLLFWYTDGLTERTDAKGRPIGKAKLLRTIGDLAASQPTDLGAACDHLMTELGVAAESHPADDITIVIGKFV